MAFGIDWANEDNAEKLERELSVLVSYYLDNPNIKPCSMIGEKIYKIGIDGIGATRECGASLHMRAYDINGISYPCQFFLPNSIGNTKAKESLLIKWHGEEIPIDKLDSRCKDCVLKSSCHICYGANWDSTNNIYTHEENWCNLNKIIFKARAYYQLKLFERGLLQGSEFEQKATIKVLF